MAQRLSKNLGTWTSDRSGSTSSSPVLSSVSIDEDRVDGSDPVDDKGKDREVHLQAMRGLHLGVLTGPPADSGTPRTPTFPAGAGDAATPRSDRSPRPSHHALPVDLSNHIADMLTGSEPLALRVDTFLTDLKDCMDANDPAELRAFLQREVGLHDAQALENRLRNLGSSSGGSVAYLVSFFIAKCVATGTHLGGVPLVGVALYPVIAGCLHYLLAEPVAGKLRQFFALPPGTDTTHYQRYYKAVARRREAEWCGDQVAFDHYTREVGDALDAIVTDERGGFWHCLPAGREWAGLRAACRAWAKDELPFHTFSFAYLFAAIPRLLMEDSWLAAGLDLCAYAVCGVLAGIAYARLSDLARTGFAPATGAVAPGIEGQRIGHRHERRGLAQAVPPTLEAVKETIDRTRVELLRREQALQSTMSPRVQRLHQRYFRTRTLEQLTREVAASPHHDTRFEDLHDLPPDEHQLRLSYLLALCDEADRKLAEVAPDALQLPVAWHKHSPDHHHARRMEAIKAEYRKAWGDQNAVIWSICRMVGNCASLLPVTLLLAVLPQAVGPARVAGHLCVGLTLISGWTLLRQPVSLAAHAAAHGAIGGAQAVIGRGAQGVWPSERLATVPLNHALVDGVDDVVIDDVVIDDVVIDDVVIDEVRVDGSDDVVIDIGDLLDAGEGGDRGDDPANA